MVDIFDTLLLKLLRDNSEHIDFEGSLRDLYYRKVMNRVFQLTTDLWEYYNLFEKVAENDLYTHNKEGPLFALNDWRHALIGLDGMMASFCRERGIEHDSKDAYPDRYPIPCEYGTGKVMKVDANDLLGGGSD